MMRCCCYSRVQTPSSAPGGAAWGSLLGPPTRGLHICPAVCSVLEPLTMKVNPSFPHGERGHYSPVSFHTSINSCSDKQTRACTWCKLPGTESVFPATADGHGHTLPGKVLPNHSRQAPALGAAGTCARREGQRDLFLKQRCIQR